MMDPVLNRQMFQGGAQQPGDKGIIGLVDDGAPAKAMEAVAGSVDKFEQGVDGAQDYEQLMNAVRGNQAPIAQRYAELAKVVGEEDARATPESVLAVAQPALELLSGKGIEALTGMAGGQPPAPQGPPPPVQGFAGGGSVAPYDKDFADYSARVDRILPQRNLDQLVMERKSLMADDDTSGFDANLALMKYGSQVANTPGGILSALTKPAGEFAGDLSKVANRRADISRAIKTSAINSTENDREFSGKAKLSGLHEAYSNSNINAREAATRAFTATENEKNRNLQTSVTGTEAMILPTPGATPFGVRRTEKGLQTLDGKPVPADAIPLDATTAVMLGYGKNQNKLTGFDGTIIDESREEGVRPARIMQDDNGNMFYEENNKWRKVDNAQVIAMPYDKVVNTKEDADSKGRAIVTINDGPKKGTTFMRENGVTKSSVKVPDVDTAIKLRNSVDAPSPIGALDPNGIEKPYIKVTAPNFTRGRMPLGPKKADEMEADIANSEQLVRESSQLIEAIDDGKGNSAVGIWPSTKDFVANVSGGFAPDWAVDANNAALRNRLRAWTKTVQQDRVLNSRMTQKEQDLVAKMGGSPEEFFKDPRTAMAIIREVVNQSINRMEANKATLRGDDFILERARMPAGSPTDPFDLSKESDKAYLLGLKSRGMSTKGLKVRNGDVIGEI
jgi:hypothetical protein